MFCPKCGKGEQNPNVYCRQCGEWLPDMTRKNPPRSPQQHIQTSLVISVMTAVTAIALAIALYANYLGKENVSGLIYLTAAFLIAIAGWQISSFYSAYNVYRQFKRRAANQESQPQQIKSASYNALPEGDTSQFVSPQSVTENTTELLEPIPSKRHRSS